MTRTQTRSVRAAVACVLLLKITEAFLPYHDSLAMRKGCRSRSFIETTLQQRCTTTRQRSHHLDLSGQRMIFRLKTVMDDEEEESDDEDDEIEDEEEGDDDMDDYDDEDGDDKDFDPLARGVDSVAWLPSVVGAKEPIKVIAESISSNVDNDEAQVIPLFPLGGIVYTPNTEHVLNIFEPRYRQMYSDILMNGSKKFAVSMSHPSSPGRFAAYGVLFELVDLKEVGDLTGDRIKYICNHKVTGRVMIHRILNPDVWETRDTYLRVEGTIINESGEVGGGEGIDDETKTVASSNDVYTAIAHATDHNNNPREEKALRDSFAKLVEIQHELEEDVRFMRATIMSLAVKPGSGKDGLWNSVRLWQSFIDQRLMSRQSELQRDFQSRLQEYLTKEKGMEEDKLPSAIDFTDLPPALQGEVKELQQRMAVDLKPLVLESTLTMQTFLEAPDHTTRVRLLRHFVEAERKRLVSRKTLKGMFSGTLSAVDAAMPAEERDIEDDPSLKKSPDKDCLPTTEQASASTSIFFDEEDAFQ